MTEKGNFSPHALPISVRSPLRGIMKLSGRYKPLTRLTLGLPSVIINPSWNHRAGLNAHSIANSTFLSWCFYTQVLHRVSKVQQRMCLLGERRTRVQSILTLSWRSRMTPKMKGRCFKPCVTPGVMTSGGEEFYLARDQAWPLKLFV